MAVSTVSEVQILLSAFWIEKTVVDSEISENACEVCRVVKCDDFSKETSEERTTEDWSSSLAGCEISCLFRPLCRSVAVDIVVVVGKLRFGEPYYCA